MKRSLAFLAVLMAAGCQNPDITRYNYDLDHPYRLTEASVRMPLEGAVGDKLTTAITQFAAERPNDGSTFIVSAPTDVMSAARQALMAAAIDPRDIRLVPEGKPAEIVRTDRFVSVVGCQGAPRRKGIGEYLFSDEDGWASDETPSSLLGCAIKRNISEMVADPRALAGQVHNSGRNGVKGADVYQKWSVGASPWANYTLPTWTTSGISGGGSGQ